MPKIYHRLKSKCELAGLTVKDVCEHAGVPFRRIYQWRYREPESLKNPPEPVQVMERLEAAIEELSEQKAAESEDV